MCASVLLGISGGIAAYKTPALVRLLVQANVNVNVVMTQAATQFVTPLTLATISGNPVFQDMWGDRHRPSVEHISLADQADLALVAPATANVIGKMAAGIADDMLTTVFMALTCPILLCPSMNVNMYKHPILQSNLQKLAGLGHHILAPESGFLACGWTGEGRMPEPEMIADKVFSLLNPGDLKGLRILVTAGPTEEPLDPVRFLTNRSSGKMGVAICRRASQRGASVILVSGPLKIGVPQGITHVPVRTALEMHDRVLESFPETDIVIKAAAVADFRPAEVQTSKIKKNDVKSPLRLIKNPDILQELGRIKRKDQILVGFAAETQDVLEHARKKLKNKNLDMLVLNDVSRPGAGFDCDTNIVRFLYRSGDEEQLDMMSKDKVADHILDRVLDMSTRASVQGDA
ncbi:MAG TPA: bifunctional phosphopantothenoylcysteine decarboxylase/phosphopantothenate--cysteine ligase CoaBC [Desulfomonilaceae bacterium]|nr:bifunctional phosphopantothenoylcysteine decarboxylase/phosphopantothenate--cysteine ligase CoaBC [Desulfomonilaceae bacterium]